MYCIQPYLNSTITCNSNIIPFQSAYLNSQQISVPYGPQYKFKGCDVSVFNGYGGFQFNGVTAAPQNHFSNNYKFKGTSTSSSTGNTYPIQTPQPGKTYRFREEKPKARKRKSSTSRPTRNLTEEQFRAKLVHNFERYLGYNEKDGSYRKFSDSPEWCADFVTYVVKKTYRQIGKPLPEGFGNHRCEILKQWAIENDCLIMVAEQENRTDIIKNQVKVGDILILRENGASHTGIVTKINDNGSFETIEGNVTEGGTDKVTRNRYSADNEEITGFIRLPY